MVKVLFYFLQYSLTRINRFNVLFQSEGCRVFKLESVAQELLKAYLLNFIKADVVNESDDVTKINYTSPSNHKSDEDLSIGQQASRYLQTINDECEPAAIAQFYKSVKMGYIAAVDKKLKKFPFNCEMLKAVRLLNPNNRLQLTEGEVLLVAEKLLPNFTDEQLDKLLDEWKIYQVQAVASLPEFNGDDTALWWAQVFKRKDFVDGDKPLFTQLMKLIKILYNQAPVERIFSMVRKVDTKFHTTISHYSICSMLSCKINCASDCYAVEIPNTLIRSAKTAINQYNTELGAKT